MEAIILAGGKGTRLRSVIGEYPKPMALINDVPFLEKQFDWLIDQGVSHLIVSVGYKYNVITEYFGDSYKNTGITYVIEETPLGTGGAISLASKFCKEDNVFVVNGDTYYPIELKSMINSFDNSDISIAIKYMDPADRYGLVQLDNNKIVGFEEKKLSSSGFINAGIYLLSKMFLSQLPESGFSFEEYLQINLSKINASSYRTIDDTYFIDIGVPEDYEKAQKLIN